MNTVRLNITLPAELFKQLDRVAGRKKKSRFIAEALNKRIKEMKDERLQQLLEEGYKATRDEGLAITREFEPIDFDGWDEY